MKILKIFLLTTMVLSGLLLPALAEDRVVVPGSTGDGAIGQFIRENVMNKLNSDSYDIFLDQLNEYWTERTGNVIGGNEDLFKKIVDMGKVTTAVEIGENIYAGDYKAAAGAGELAIAEAYVPAIGWVLLAGKALDAEIQSLNKDIFNANFNKIYNDIYKADPVYFTPAGIDKFMDYLYAPGAGKLKVRAFFYEYAKEVGNELPANWAGTESGPAYKQVRVVVNTLRRDMLKQQQIEQKKKDLETQRQMLRTALDAFKNKLKFLATDATKKWILSKVAELLEKQSMVTEMPALNDKIINTFNEFSKYYNYFMKLVDSGQAITISRRGGEYDGGPGCTCPPPLSGRALSQAASYSLVQASKLQEQFKGMAGDFRSLYNRLLKLINTNPGAEDLKKLKEAADEINSNYFTPENIVDSMYSEMNQKVDQLDLGEKDGVIQSGTKPDGIDPVFAPNVLNLDTVPATTPK